jgi:hypothetical protein
MIGYSLHSAGKTKHLQKDATDLFYRNLKQRKQKQAVYHRIVNF